VTEATLGCPARDRVEDSVELVLRALLDADLPAVALERDEVDAGESDEIADELIGGVGRRRLDAYCVNS
jgi:hypothetical protein